MLQLDYTTIIHHHIKKVNTFLHFFLKNNKNIKKKEKSKRKKKKNEKHKHISEQKANSGIVLNEKKSRGQRPQTHITVMPA